MSILSIIGIVIAVLFVAGIIWDTISSRRKPAEPEAQPWDIDPRER